MFRLVLWECYRGERTIKSSSRHLAGHQQIPARLRYRPEKALESCPFAARPYHCPAVAVLQGQHYRHLAGLAGSESRNSGSSLC